MKIIITKDDLKYLIEKISTDNSFYKTKRLGLLNDVFVFNMPGIYNKNIEFYDLSKDIIFHLNTKDSKIFIEDMIGPIDKRKNTKIANIIIDIKLNHGLVQPTEEIMTVFLKNFGKHIANITDLNIDETTAIYIFSKLTGLSGKYWLENHTHNHRHFIDFGGIFFGKSSAIQSYPNLHKEKILLISML